MTLWWPNAFPDKPWRTWFWARRPGEDDAGLKFREWPPGYYWFYKIPPEAGHKEQLAFRSPEDRRCYDWQRFNCSIKANVIYIITHEGDTPNWGNSTLVSIGPPCGNWRSSMYELQGVTRNQTSGITAAVQTRRIASSRIRSSIAKTLKLNTKVSAVVQTQRVSTSKCRAAIRGENYQLSNIRSAVRTTRMVEYEVVSAIGKDFSLGSKVTAAVQGNPIRYVRYRCALKGESQKLSCITALVALSRADKIMLEMENLWPQEFDLRSVPNWASEFKDWRTRRLGT